MPELHVVIGAGPVGATIAEQLAAAGARVRVLTRSGSGPEHARIERRAVDVSQRTRLSGQFDGARAVYHCMHTSRYVAADWWAELPPTEQVVMNEAERAGAVVVFPESLYSYGPVREPMRESMDRAANFGKPAVRVALLKARAEHRAHTVSVAASDFIGPHVHTALAGDIILRPLLAGKRIRTMGDLDAPHAFTYMPDLAAAMIKAASDTALWDSFLHAPTAAPISQRELIRRYADAAGAGAPKVFAAPGWLLRAGGWFNTDMREMAEMVYQFERPFTLDSTASEARLGFGPTPFDTVIETTVAWRREQV
ncbi:NAD-dependent epimerase/dehydratase family protein [Nocardia panacis]|uniref:NAD-dependent epimerase/dehydratase family protein n=1 Tax=Nocardia panacis TaxID=2340916 RepID=A0A3A4KGN2_9NOCA|nr:NAD-dependent epimerase/dehydratase family protein [Nocardia panacis]RJO73418.1 NAD-dependent epimerase/dehydratase family protein [Nocardia panacis]